MLENTQQLRDNSFDGRQIEWVTSVADTLPLQMVATLIGLPAHFYVGDYEISDGMEAFLRIDVNGVAGNPLTVTGNVATPGPQLNSVRLAPGESAKVAFVIGMPFEAGNSSQNGSITPNWSVDLTLDSTDTPVTPGGTGSLDFGSLSFGSTDFGSASFGSLDTGSVKTGSVSSGSLDVGSLGKPVTYIG